jgi:competence protein ComEC
MAAYASTVPVAASCFGRVAPVALLSNLGAAPLCAWVLGSGFATILLEPVPVLGEMAAHSTEAGARVLIGLARTAASLPGSSWRVAAPHSSLVTAHYLLICLSVAHAGRVSGTTGRVFHRGSLLALAVCLALIHLGPFPRDPRAMMKVVVADVGQAQSVLVRGPDGGCVVADAGGTSGGRFDAGERVVAPLLLRHGCRRIDVLVLTHDDDDHAGGAVALLREIEVDELWYGAGTHRRPRTRRIREAARARGVATRMVGRGVGLRRAGLSLEVLHPGSSDEGLDVNNRSVVLRVAAGSRRLLIVGDLEAAGERSLLAAGIDPSTDVLVVGHHGAGAATSPLFLAAARPAMAAISAGAWNRFGHPSPEVLDRLAAGDVTVRRTDRDGTIVFVAGPQGWRAFPARGSPEGERNRDEAGEEDEQQ